MHGEKLIRNNPSGELKTCIAGQITEQINAEAREQEGHHQTFKNTWFTILSGPYQWPTRKRYVANYYEEYPVRLQRNVERLHKQENDILVLDMVSEDESTTKKNQATKWMLPYFECLRNAQVLEVNITKEK